MYLVLVQVPGTVPVIVHIRTTILLLKIHVEELKKDPTIRVQVPQTLDDLHDM